jgi:quinol monooxygenase YgiN
MSTFDNAVSINPYFKIEDGKMDECKGFLAQFCELVTKNEEGCLFYNFTFKGNEMCCREAYVDAQAVLAHLENCGPALGEFLGAGIAALSRIELHGPAGELAKLKEAFTDFNPDYYESDCGIGN